MKYAPLLLCCFFLCTLLGCGGQEYTYVDDREVKPGPGLLSGEAGGFYLLGEKSTEQDPTAAEEQQQKQDTVDQPNQQ